MISSLVLFLFFVWLLPLGVFIDPLKEDKVCGGERAICLCSHHLLKASKDQTSGKRFIASSRPLNKEAGSHGGSHYFLVGKIAEKSFFSHSRIFDSEKNPYALLISRVIEHVPKYFLS